MLALLVALLAATAPATEPPPAPEAVIEGLVLSMPSRTPLGFATVGVGDVEGLTDEEGRFRLDGLVPGTGTLRVVADGHRPYELSIELGDAPVSVEVKLRRAPGPRARTVVRTGDRWVPDDRPPAQESPDLVLTPVELERAPGGLGDPFRALQAQAPLQEDLGSKAAFAPYGGSEDELRVEIDDIPLRRRTHLTGLIGALPVEVIDRMTLSSAPSERPDALGGVLAVKLRDGPEGDAFDGVVDLNLLGLTAAVGAELDPRGKHRLLVGVRQSFAAPYLELASAVGAFEGEPPRGDYGEGVLRYSAGDQRLRFHLTAFASRDRLLLDDVNERRRILGGSVGVRRQWSSGLVLSAVLSHGSSVDDEPEVEGFVYPHVRSYVDAEHWTRLRVQMAGDVLPGWTLSGGVQADHALRVARGDFPDDRAAPAWLHRPLADLAVPQRVLDEQISEPGIAVHAQFEGRRIAGPLHAQVGVRADLLRLRGRPTVSPRARLWAPFDSGTTVGVGVALLHQSVRDAWRVRELALGADDRPERALVIDARVAQRLGPLRLELAGQHRALDQILVMADGVEAYPLAVRESVGRGSASTLRASARLDLGRIHASAAYTLGQARRRIGEQLVAGAGDRRHAADVLVEATLGKRRGFILGGAWGYRSGPTVATLEPVPSEEAGAVRWLLVDKDSRRRPDRHRFGIRAEHRLVDRAVRLRGMAELAVLAGGASTEDCPSVGENGEPAACRELAFLPVVMPWLGLKADW